MSTDLADARASVLTLSEDSDPAAFEETRSMLDAIQERVRELDTQWRRAALARCEQRGEMVLMGHRRYFAGRDKDVKCKDVKAAIEAIYDETGGDFEALVGCLSANALKPGATRGVLSPERFAAVFETVEKVRLKNADVKTPAGKVLIEVDTDFVK